jgi:phosphatidate cytidylyltransferase
MSMQLTKRIIAGISVAIAFASLMAFCPGPVQFVFLLAFALACQAEFYALAMRGGYRVYNHTGCVLGALWFLAVYVLTGPRTMQNGTTYGNLVADWESALIFGGCFLILLRALFDKQCRHAFETTAITCLGIIYGPVMLSYFVRLAQWDSTTQFATTRSGVFLTFFIAVVIKMSDTGAFAVGTACGRHKMFPRISPKKSWEGLAGGIATGMGVGIGLALLAAKYKWGPDGVFYSSGPTAPDLTLPKAAFISALLVVIGLFGDLFESMYKRTVNIKDSRAIFPGMGGLLDVVDSLIFAPPVLYYFLIWF